MQRNRINLENLLQIVEDSQLSNFVLLVEDYGKEYTIENYNSNDNNTELAVDLIRRRVLIYPKETNFKIVLKPTPTANGTSVRTFYFSRTDQNTPNPQPQPQAQVGLGGFDNSVGLGAVELERKRAEVDMQAMEDRFALLLEKNSLKDQKMKLKDEKREFEDQQKFAIAKKIGEGLGAVAIQYAQNHPVLAGLLGQLGTTGLGAAESEDEDEYMTPKEELLNEMNESDITVEELKELLILRNQIKNSQQQHGAPIQEEEN